MSDHDRGAYAPHNEAPLQFETFDARGRGGRRPLPMTLIGSGVVLLLLVTALVMFYRSGSKSAEGLPRPVGGSLAAIKTAPGGGAQPVDPAAGLEVYSPQNVPASDPAVIAPAPRFAPEPEQPMARPVAPPPVVARVPPAPAKPAAVATAGDGAPPPAPAAKTVAVPSGAKPTVTAKAAPPTPAAPSAKPVVAKTAKPAQSSEDAEAFAAAGATTPSSTSGLLTTTSKPSAPKPTTTKVATAAAKPAPAKITATADIGAAGLPKGPLAPTKPAAAPAAKGAFTVQVGAFPTAADANKEIDIASAKAGGALTGKSKGVETVQKDGKTIYRSTVKGFGSKSEAAAFCAALRAKGGQCMVRGAGA